jgi:hypothetical protein
MTTEQAFSAVSKPSVPEFTVKFVNASYTETTKNPYTGLYETELINNNSIEITIKNQPVDYPDCQLYYSVRIKPHFADNDWTNVSTSMLQSNSSYTIIAFPVVPTTMHGETGYDLQKGDYTVFYALPDGSQLDFQVKAFVGHYETEWVSGWYGIGGEYVESLVVDTESDWSETQTFTINNYDSTTNTETPEQKDQEPETQQTDWLTVITDGALILIPIAAGLGLLIHLSKRK